MNKKKTIAVAIVLALVLLIGGMLAFFTDTDTKTNVFVLGDVDISLSEETWESNGINEANGILPGASAQKDPVITNDSDTLPAYVFCEVIVPCYDSDDTDEVSYAPLFTLNDIGTGWNLMSTTPDNDNKTITYVYNYGTASAMTSLAANASTPAVFSSVTLVDTLTSAQKDTAPSNTNIVVNAYGIQTTELGVTTPSDIFDLF